MSALTFLIAGALLLSAAASFFCKLAIRIFKASTDNLGMTFSA
jgi:hypothetical protein